MTITLPVVKIEESEIEKLINECLQNGENASINFAKVLSSLGFSSDDSLVLSDFNHYYRSSFSMHSYKTDSKCIVILDKSSGNDSILRMTLESINTSTTYFIDYNYQNEIITRLDKYQVKSNKNKYQRNFFSNMLIAIVNDGEYFITLSIVSSKKHEPYKLENEGLLYNYFMRLVFPCNIEEVFENIRLIIGEDYNSPRVSLKLEQRETSGDVKMLYHSVSKLGKLYTLNNEIVKDDSDLIPDRLVRIDKKSTQQQE